jgi:hypothetical protein
VASVLGETFTFDLLSAVFPIDIEEETLRMHLADLMARNFFQVQLEVARTHHSLAATVQQQHH